MSHSGVDRKIREGIWLISSDCSKVIRKFFWAFGAILPSETFAFWRGAADQITRKLTVSVAGIGQVYIQREKWFERGDDVWRFGVQATLNWNTPTASPVDVPASPLQLRRSTPCEDRKGY